MSLEEQLAGQGWHLSPAGLLSCPGKTAKEVVRQALDKDLKDIGSACLPEDINRGKVEEVEGPLVLMVTKMRNLAIPKAKEEAGAGGGTRMLKISLSDGSLTCQAVEVSPCPALSLQTPPGTKVLLKKGKVSVAGGFIRLAGHNIEVLGGRVAALEERWLTQQSLQHFTRTDLRTAGEGPPKWIEFGSRRQLPKADPNDKNFKALPGKEKAEGEEEDEEFNEERKKAIEEATTKGEQKKFGGGGQIQTKREQKSSSMEKQWERGQSYTACPPPAEGER